MNLVSVFALALLSLGVTFSEAHANTEPWCGPVSATLVFLDQQGRDAVRIELRSPTQVCTTRERDETVGLYREPEMRVDFYGKAIAVPNSCLKDLAFRLSDLTVDVGERGVGIKIFGKLIDRAIGMRLVIYTVDNEVFCNQTAE